MSDEMDIILLYDENDNETEFEVVATLEVDENGEDILIGIDVLLPTLSAKGLLKLHDRLQIC